MQALWIQRGESLALITRAVIEYNKKHKESKWNGKLDKADGSDDDKTCCVLSELLWYLIDTSCYGLYSPKTVFLSLRLLALDASFCGKLINLRLLIATQNLETTVRNLHVVFLSRARAVKNDNLLVSGRICKRLLTVGSVLVMTKHAAFFQTF